MYRKNAILDVMKSFKIYLFIFNTISSLAFSQTVDNCEFEFKNDILYYKKDSQPYTGTFQEWYEGPLSTEGTYLNGLKNGKFVKYDIDGNVYSVQNYTNGKKDGEFLRFNTRENSPSILILKEYYKNGFLKESTQWDISGQSKMQMKDGLTRHFQVDTCLYEINIHINNEYTINTEGWKKYRVLPNSIFQPLDSIKLNIVKILYDSCNTTSIPKFDTIIVNNFKIKEFLINPVRRGSSVSFPKIYGEFIPKNIVENISRAIIQNSLEWIDFYEVIIEDPNGVQLYIPKVHYKIYRNKY